MRRLLHATGALATIGIALRKRKQVGLNRSGDGLGGGGGGGVNGGNGTGDDEATTKARTMFFMVYSFIWVVLIFFWTRQMK